ncbi:FAD-binding oxidoreductase [Streptomyces sp. NPDC058357]|uniref:FAD-binding oxidoreductase n=1 Tax=unclassified Streptomyces TaxID=2593676 RepID=UPI00365D511E
MTLPEQGGGRRGCAVARHGVGNNSAGSGSLRYGTTIGHVRALDVVLSDGSTARLEPVDETERGRRAGLPTLEGRLHRDLPLLVRANADAIAEGFPDFWRRACGYRLDRLAREDTPFDLAKFVVGSEGTLAIATRALVDLVPEPGRTVIAVGHFPSVVAAIEATESALACHPSAVELMDRTILDLSRRKIEYASLGTLLQGNPRSTPLRQLHRRRRDRTPGPPGSVDQPVESPRPRLPHPAGRHPEQQASLLKVRKSSLGLLMAAGEGTRRPLAFVEDTAVDPAHLAEYTRRFKDILDEHGLTARFYGHCSVGCLRIRPFVDLADPRQITTMRTVAERVKDLVTEYGGVDSSEHGDGLARSECNREIFGDALYEAMRSVKSLIV